MTEYVEVMWYTGGSGVRAGKLYGVSKVHLAEAGTRDPICGARGPSLAHRRRSLNPDRSDPRCLRCQRISSKKAGPA